jgi:iron complex outermembrane receptor protein
MRGRIAVNIIDQGDGWQEDVATGRQYGMDESQAVRGLLDFDAADNVSGLLKLHYTSVNAVPLSPDTEQQEYLGYPELNSPLDPSQVTVGNLDAERDEEGYGLGLTLNVDFEAFTFTSISAWDTYDQYVVDNYDGSAATLGDQFLETDIGQWSQEFRLTDNGSDRLSWILGASYSEEFIDVTSFADDSFLVFGDDNGDGDYSNDRGLDLLAADYRQKSQSYGLYLHTETELNDELKLTVGLRYSLDEREFDGRSSITDTQGFFDDTIAVLDESHDEDGVTGKIGIDWAPNNDWLLYANVATSYKSGLFYGSATLDADPGRGWGYVEPEEVTSYEAGFKATLLGDTLQINGAAFFLQYDNRQSIAAFVENDSSTYLGFEVVDVTMVNVPESEVNGAELDLRWLPLQGMDLRLGAAYLNSKVTAVPTAADMRGISPDSSLDFTVDHLLNEIGEGQTLAQSPEWSYNGLAAYEWSAGDGLIPRVQISYSWLDSQLSGLGDSNAAYGSVSSLDAQFSIADAEELWSVSVWGKNLESNDAETYAFSGFSGRVVYRQQPASYGVTLRYNF